MIFDEQISLEADHYPWAQEFIEAIHNGFWTDKLFTFASDVQDFKVKLSEQDREIIVRALSAIAQIEVQVKTFWAKLGDNLPHPSLRDLGYVMANTEVIHGNAYKRLLKVLGIKGIFDENLKLDIIKGRTTYLRKYNHKFYKDSKKQYIYAMALFTLFVENVSLFSQFYIINWYYKNKNVLKDTNQQVKYTRQEETIHALVGMRTINQFRTEHPELFDKELDDRIIHEAGQAILAEGNICGWMVGDFNEPGLNAAILQEFIKNRMNESLKQIGYKPIFEINEELMKETQWFDETLIGNTATDFFHTRPVEYSKNNKSFDEDSLFAP